MCCNRHNKSRKAHRLLLLDPPDEITETPAAENLVHQVSIEFHTNTAEKLRLNFESYRPNMTDEEYQECIDWLEEKFRSNEEFLTFSLHNLVDGFIMPYLVRKAIAFRTAFRSSSPKVKKRGRHNQKD